MSIKSILNGKSELDCEFQKILKESVPSKASFSTVFGSAPFTTDEPLIAYSLVNSAEAGLVGTAFDYLARAMVTQVLDKGKDPAWMNLKAQQGIARIEKRATSKERKELKSKYVDFLTDYLDYIYSNYAEITFRIEEMDEYEAKASQKFLLKALMSNYQPIIDVCRLIPAAVFFARLEQVFRIGGILADGGVKELMEPPSDRIVEEIAAMCKLFQQRFIENGLVKPESIVVFNPSFGSLSLVCGGADADIYVDGTLYDFKSGKGHGYAWKEVAQIVAYYYLNLLCSWYGQSKAPAQLQEYRILSLAFYRARYGEIEYCRTNVLDENIAFQIIKHLEKRAKAFF